MLVPGIVTWKIGNTSSTIDLAFVDDRLTENITYYTKKAEIEYSSDHYPISTILMLTVREVQTIRR